MLGPVPDHDPAMPPLLLLQVSAHPPASIWLEQRTVAVSEEAMCRQFVDFWHPVWNRDSKAQAANVLEWPLFLQAMPGDASLPGLGQPGVLACCTQTHGSPQGHGICGVAVDELRSMPDIVLQDLVGLFRAVRLQGRFPGYMCRSSVSCVPKVGLPLSIGDCRPITAFSSLYRFYSCAIARAVLAQWATCLPSGIYGALPGRSARDAALALELKVEEALLSEVRLQGLSVDLRQFFNTVPRAPAIYLMAHLGMPADVLTVWHNFLDDAHRHPVINGHYGFAILSSTGIPEGDSFSILAQAALNWMLLLFVTVVGLQILTVIDNWTFVASTCQTLLRALALTQQFCELLQLVIDQLAEIIRLVHFGP